MLSPRDGKRANFWNTVFLRIPDDEHSLKKPVMLNVTHHHQKERFSTDLYLRWWEVMFSAFN